MCFSCFNKLPYVYDKYKAMNVNHVKKARCLQVHCLCLRSARNSLTCASQ